jgi:hypothetical protein
MIKQGILLFTILLLGSAYTPAPNFDIKQVFNKTLYLNAILSTNPLNLTLDNSQSFCTGYYFTPLANGNVLSLFTLLTNFTSSNSEFTPKNGSAAEWKSTQPLPGGQWESLGTLKQYTNLTFIYADTTNDEYGAILFGNGNDIGDLFLLLSSKWDSSFDQMAKVYAIAANGGFPVPSSTYSFMNCMNFLSSGPQSGFNAKRKGGHHHLGRHNLGHRHRHGRHHHFDHQEEEDYFSIIEMDILQEEEGEASMWEEEAVAPKQEEATQEEEGNISSTATPTNAKAIATAP